MKSLIRPLRDIGFLTIALTLALVANFAYGQWANPTAAPVGGNAAIPVHTAGGYQYKEGSIGAVQLLASDKMRSDLYCDFAGNNCFRPCEVSGSCVAAVQGTWQTGSWGSCSGACGTSGTQTRSVTCSSSAGCSGAPPADSRNCQNAACSVPQGTWQTGSWGGCTGACGTTGTRYRSVTCSSTAGCAGAQPASTQSCSNAACAVTYSWQTSPPSGYCQRRPDAYMECDRVGVMYGSVSCVSSAGSTVSNSNCNSATRPATPVQGCTIPMTDFCRGGTGSDR